MDCSIQHPWRPYAARSFLWKIIPLALFAITVLIFVLIIDQLLKTDDANGYSSIEYAGDGETADKVIKSWKTDQRVIAGFSSGFHFLFFVLYSSTITLLCNWASNNVPYTALVVVGDLLAWSQILGAIFDMIVQSCAVAQIANGGDDDLARLAIASAVIHVVILATGFLFWLAILILRYTVWRGREPAAKLNLENVPNA